MERKCNADSVKAEEDMAAHSVYRHESAESLPPRRPRPNEMEGHRTA